MVDSATALRKQALRAERLYLAHGDLIRQRAHACLLDQSKSAQSRTTLLHDHSEDYVDDVGDDGRIAPDRVPDEACLILMALLVANDRLQIEAPERWGGGSPDGADVITFELPLADWVARFEWMLGKADNVCQPIYDQTAIVRAAEHSLNVVKEFVTVDAMRERRSSKQSEAQPQIELHRHTPKRSRKDAIRNKMVFDLRQKYADMSWAELAGMVQSAHRQEPRLDGYTMGYSTNSLKKYIGEYEADYGVWVSNSCQ